MSDAPKRSPGRPRILRPDGKRMTVTLDQPCYDEAARLGNGKINTGIRKALQLSLQAGANLKREPTHEPI